MSKYHDLLERAKWSTISEAELDSVAVELQKADQEHRYTLLHILGRGGEQMLTRGSTVTLSYIKLVEPFLKGPDDLLARLALWILCRWWGLVDSYTDELLEFMRGMPWDESEEGRRAATAIAGEYLSKSTNPELLQSVIRIFDDKYETPLLREYAYRALATALGNASKLPPLHEDLDLDAQIDATVVWEARVRLAQEK